MATTRGIFQVHRGDGTKTKQFETRCPWSHGCATIHRLKWGLLPQSDVSRIAQHLKEEEGKERIGIGSQFGKSVFNGGMGCAAIHRLKWGLLPQNDVSRIAQHLKKEEGKERIGIGSQFGKSVFYGGMSCAAIHRLKWGLLPPNDVSRIAQHLKEEERKKERKERIGIGSQFGKSVVYGGMGCAAIHRLK